jgi:hypothetical protein
MNFRPIVQRFFQTQVYNHAYFQKNRPTIERTINNFIFRPTEEEENFLNESAAELVRDGLFGEND